jgi:hypothetical protein
MRRLIEECNMSFTLSCAEEVDCSAEPSTYTKAVVSGDREKWVVAIQEEMQSLEKNGTLRHCSLACREEGSTLQMDFQEKRRFFS